MDTVDKSKVILTTEFIKLDQFLKWQNIVSSGSEAKFLISAGKVIVNEEIEYRRGRKLVPGDMIQIDDHQFCLEK